MSGQEPLQGARGVRGSPGEKGDAQPWKLPAAGSDWAGEGESRLQGWEGSGRAALQRLELGCAGKVLGQSSWEIHTPA